MHSNINHDAALSDAELRDIDGSIAQYLQEAPSAIGEAHIAGVLVRSDIVSDCQWPVTISIPKIALNRFFDGVLEYEANMAQESPITFLTLTLQFQIISEGIFQTGTDYCTLTHKDKRYKSAPTPLDGKLKVMLPCLDNAHFSMTDISGHRWELSEYVECKHLL